MTSYIILGGNGSFGVTAAKYLLGQSETARVICVGRAPEKSEPFTLNVGKDDARYSYQKIHVRFGFDALIRLFDEARPDVIVNFAAQGEGAVSWKNSWKYFDTNATALARIGEYLAQCNYLKRWIQIGTSELYGSVTAPAREDAPFQPTSPYAASKAAGDMYLLAMAKTSKFPMNILRPSNAYCPGQLLHRVIPRAVVCGLSGQKLPLQGGGAVRKSYIHARDLSRAIHLVATKPAPLGKVYNVGPAEPISIRRVMEVAAEALEIPFEQLCEVTPGRFGEDACYWLDSSAIKADVGWQQEISLQDGLAEMVAWGRQYLTELQATPQSYTFRD